MLPGPSPQASLIGPSGQPKDREPILAQALSHYLTDTGNGGEVQPGRATKRASLPNQRGVHAGRLHHGRGGDVGGGGIDERAIFSEAPPIAIIVVIFPSLS